MPFVEAIKQFNSVSIVGMAKNTGKTTCLNYVIDRLNNVDTQGRTALKTQRLRQPLKIALTSIGVDGEERDVLYDTPKPRIVIREGMVFVTSEKDFEECEFEAEVLSVSERSTPLGRLITARARGCGKVVLSGPSDSAWLHSTIASMSDFGVSLTLVDGALSRVSLSSPAVTDAMILCTGAACSPQLPELIRRTKFRCDLIELEQVSDTFAAALQLLGSGVWVPVSHDELNGDWEKTGDSVFTLEKLSEDVRTVYVSGAVTEHFFKLLNTKRNRNIQLIVSDFTKLFITPLTYDIFTRSGGRIKVLQKAKLLAVCTNPTSPEGVRLNPEMLREQMQAALGLPVYDVVHTKRNYDFNNDKFN